MKRGLELGGGNKAYRTILTEAVGPAPDGMFDPHAHHTVFKLGQVSQRQLVLKAQTFLREVGIHPEFGPQNLVWAPNRVVGQHSTEALRPLVDALESARGSRVDIETVLREFSELSRGR